MPDSLLPVVVAICSQKGGVGKSTVARAFAASVAKETGGRVKIIDVDRLQETSREWARRRSQLGIKPAINVAVAARIVNLRELAGDADVLIIDCAGRASRETLTIAKQAHLIVQPTSASSDDLKPGLALFQELLEEGIGKDRLVWALSRVSSEAEERDIRQYLTGEGWSVLKGCLFNRSAYTRAMDAGYSVTETPFKSLNEKAAELVGSLNDALKRTVTVIYQQAKERTRKADVAA